MPGGYLSRPPQCECEASVDRDCPCVGSRRRIPRGSAIVLLTLKKCLERERRAGADRRRANRSNAVPLPQLTKNVDGKQVGRLLDGRRHCVLFGENRVVGGIEYSVMQSYRVADGRYHVTIDRVL